MTSIPDAPPGGTEPLAARLRRIPAIRHAPVTAMLILLSVCCAGLGLVLADPGQFALSTAPLVAVVALFLRAERRL